MYKTLDLPSEVREINLIHQLISRGDPPKFLHEKLKMLKIGKGDGCWILQNDQDQDIAKLTCDCVGGNVGSCLRVLKVEII